MTAPDPLGGPPLDGRAVASESERAIVGALLVSGPEALRRLDGLSLSDLRDSRARRVVAVARDLASRGALDHLLLADALRRLDHDEGLDGFLADAVAAVDPVATVSVLPSHVVRVAEAARLRDLDALGVRLRKGVAAGLRPDVVLDDARERLDLLAGASVSTLALPWRSPGEVLDAAKATPREWLLPRVLYFGAVALLVGGPKVSGKSTLEVALLGAALAGEDLFGRPLACGRVGAVLLTEEADCDLAAKLPAFAVKRDANLSILSRHALRPRPSWADAIRAATARAVERKARILAVDTYYRWACFTGDDSKKSEAVLATLDTLEEARAAGLLTLLLHHPAKGAAEAGRTGGMAGLGSVSLPGETEVNLELRSGGDKAHPERRVLRVESRAPESGGAFDLLIALVRGDPASGKPDRFEEVGDLAEVTRQEVESRVVAFVAANPGATSPEIERGAGVRESAVQAALPRLRGEGGRLDYTGEGKAGSPRRYWPKGAAPAEEQVSRRSRPSPAGGDLTGAERMSPAAPAAPSIGEGRAGGRRSKRSGGGRKRSSSARSGGRREGVGPLGLAGPASVPGDTLGEGRSAP